MVASSCGTDPGARSGAAEVTVGPSARVAPSAAQVRPSWPALDFPDFGLPPSPRTSAGPTPSPSRTTSRSSGRVSDGWEVTVYYTAVEKFHDGDPRAVTGCLKLDCSNGDDDLGTYPEDFVQAVEDEGTGRTASGRYLNWSYDIGFWLDSQPRSADGRALVPFVSAAADPGVLPYGTRFTISACGRQDDGSALPGTTCAALRRASWLITDEFTPGLGGSRHLDAYIGPETGPDFTDSDWYVTLHGARLTIG
ncbi:hypothetical protein M1L60_40245 [Actinoplanes sp. TRM 88003]|uniref:Uncharacterized protein n=1 Tax=Paractinoplanes aksuensis TaxID=2939490 RepID=A0ABT1E106_9ACTN|nr:hypothetical protein [Actinoplanes aksuensis]MCO8276830.1 hypothetical protein [Actinoplanes aksuensis]